jgi:hypothetical protein
MKFLDQVKDLVKNKNFEELYILLQCSKLLPEAMKICELTREESGVSEDFQNQYLEFLEESSLAPSTEFLETYQLSLIDFWRQIDTQSSKKEKRPTSVRLEMDKYLGERIS